MKNVGSKMKPITHSPHSLDIAVTGDDAVDSLCWFVCYIIVTHTIRRNITVLCTARF